MLPHSARSARFLRWFGRHATRRLRRAFDHWHFCGLEELARSATRGPVIVVANHSSFWDAMLIAVLDRELGLESYALMDRRNLTDRPFLKKAGAVGIDLRDPLAAARDLRMVASLLEGPRVLWIFPQGGERPAHEALEFRGGAALLARRSGATVLPMGVRYVVGESDRPHLWVSIGPPLHERTAGDPAGQAAAVRTELRRIEGALTRRANARMPGAPAHGPTSAADGFQTAYARPLPWWRRWGERVMSRRVILRPTESAHVLAPSPRDPLTPRTRTRWSEL